MKISSLITFPPVLDVLDTEGNTTTKTFICPLFIPGFFFTMLLASWEVRIGKNCDRGLENAAFLSPRPQFFPIRTHLSRSITCLSFIFLAVNWLSSRFVYATLSLNWLTRSLQTIGKNLTSQQARNSDARQRKTH